MEKELLLKGAEFVRRDMLHTAKSLDFIADEMMGNERENYEWMEYLCYVLIRDRAQHIRERAEELFTDLHIKENKPLGSKQSTEKED
jgi:hypothetical protein